MFGQDHHNDQTSAAPTDIHTGDAQAQDWQHPGDPIADSADPAIVAPSDQPAPDDVTPTDTPAPHIEPTPSEPVSEGSEPEVPETPASPALLDADNDELIDIKQQALSQLSPLVGHLDQTPEEKFRTTMMMIQATDDQTLVKSAYEAAQAITDEKTKAQALLDIVNEINYFTSHHTS